MFNTMNIRSILDKVDQKLASQPETEVLRQRFDAEVGELAITCAKNASIKETLMNAAKTVRDLPVTNPVLATAGAGIGGGIIGGVLGNSMTQRGENESEEDYNSRKMDSRLIGATAGAAIGGSLPLVSKLLGISKPTPSLASRLMNTDVLGIDGLNASNAVGLVTGPGAVATGGGAVGGFLGHSAIQGLKDRKYNATVAGSQAAAGALNSNIDSAQKLLAGTGNPQIQADLDNKLLEMTEQVVRSKVPVPPVKPPPVSLFGGKLKIPASVRSAGVGALIAQLLYQGFVGRTADKPFLEGE